LPNRGNDCFLNATIQLLSSLHKALFNPSANPITESTVHDKITEEQRSHFAEAGLHTDSEIADALTSAQEKLHVIMHKVDQGQEVTSSEVASLRGELHALGIIKASDARQESAGQVVIKLQDLMTGLSTKGNEDSKATSERVSVVHVEGDLTESAVAKEVTEAEIPLGKIIYFHDEETGGFKSYSDPQTSIGFGVGQMDFAAEDLAQVVPISFGAEETCYVHKEGHFYEVKAGQFTGETVEKLTSAGSILSVTVGRDAAARSPVDVPPEVNVDGKRYVLRATVSHVGEQRSAGHYVASRVAPDAEGVMRWTQFNDQRVHAHGAEVAATSAVKPGNVSIDGKYFAPDRLLSLNSDMLVYERVEE
jgi:hypothetical protein